MRTRIRGAVMLEIMISVMIAMLVGFSLLWFLPMSRRYTQEAQLYSQAQDVLEAGLTQVLRSGNATGNVSVAGVTYGWVGAIVSGAGPRTAQVNVTWTNLVGQPRVTTNRLAADP